MAGNNAKCTICDFEGKNPLGLAVHMRRAHGEGKKPANGRRKGVRERLVRLDSPTRQGRVHPAPSQAELDNLLLSQTVSFCLSRGVSALAMVEALRGLTK
jgi:hypothetical protein